MEEANIDNNDQYMDVKRKFNNGDGLDSLPDIKFDFARNSN